ncbi:MAG: OmpA family protein [Pseudomonadota bacterium]
MKFNYLPLSILAASVLAACSSIPDKNAQLDEARSNYATAQANPQVVKLAGNELKQASDALNKANEAAAKHEETAAVNQLAYLANQRVAISQEAAKLRTAEEVVTNANAQRDKVRLSARTKEADKAQLNADASQRLAEQSQIQSQISQQQSEESQRSAALQKQRALEAEARSSQLEGQLQELQTKKTDRGLVVTLGDMLFDTNKANLKSGGTRNVKKLADALKAHPEAKVSVEGFTDSVGNDSHNQQLSERRASAVGEALQTMGINAGRITEHGYGETAPVASNDSPEGRQLNRRVEVIISNDANQVAPR